MNTCIKCKETKSWDQFYRSAKMKSGYLNTCKVCHIDYIMNKYQHKGGSKRKEEVTYIGVHKRLVRDRGPASIHKCVDCGEQAKDWAYNNNGTIKRYDEASGREYSLDQNDYDPRCRGCHLAFDRKKVSA